MEARTVVGAVNYNPCINTTDVVWAWNSARLGLAGDTRCVRRRANGNCDQFQIRLYKNEINDTAHPASQLRKTACHELGHTLGVSHYSGSDRPGNDSSHSCMRNGEVPSANRTWHTTYGPHHINSHINPWFS